jgi:aminomethyltransferase
VTWAPTVEKLIGFGHIEETMAEPGTRVAVTWAIPGAAETIDVTATVANLPFLDLRRS